MGNLNSSSCSSFFLKTLFRVACVASVSARVRRERRDESKKKINDGGGGGEITRLETLATQAIFRAVIKVLKSLSLSVISQ